jgi:hypothetical protein
VFVLSAGGNEAAVGFIAAQTQFARGAFEGGTLIVSFIHEGGDKRINIGCYRFVVCAACNNRAVDDEHHFAARRLFAGETRDEFGEPPARDLFVKFGEFARDRCLAFA